MKPNPQLIERVAKLLYDEFDGWKQKPQVNWKYLDDSNRINFKPSYRNLAQSIVKLVKESHVKK